MWAGGLRPKRLSAVGARSMIAGSSFVDLVVGQEDPGHQPRVDDVVAAPRLGVVFEDCSGDDARGAIPRDPVAVVVADQEVRGVALVGAAVERVGVEGLVDGDL